MKSIKCPECGFVGWADAERCKKCGVVHLPNPDGYSNHTTANYEAYQRRHENYGEVKKGMAVASLVLGIVGLFSFGMVGIGAIVGLVLAVKAMGKAKRLPSQYGGQGLATAGLVLNILSVMVIVPVLVFVAIAIPNLLASYRAANEGSSIATLRSIYRAQETYQATMGDGSYGTLDQLVEKSLLPPEMATGVRNGYKFRIEPKPHTETSPATFEAVGVPVKYGQTGIRSFYIDQSGVIRAEDNRGAAATLEDPPLDERGRSSMSSRRTRSSSSDDY